MKSTKSKVINKTVWTLSLVSLFTDMASEMLYPVIPVYLQSIGFTIVTIGILEGFAEAIAGLSKAWFGNLSDRSGKRVPFIRYGYILSAVSKPMMAVFTHTWWIFFARAADRLGKGIRTGARDALLKSSSTPATKARVFSFHRSMDTIGAFIGPAIALAYLYFFPGQYPLLFLLAFLPGLAAIITTFILKEKQQPVPPPPGEFKRHPVSFFIFITYWKNSKPAYKKLAGALVAFALVNSSDVFLLLKAKQVLQSDTKVIGLYILYNMVYALFAYPAGMLADKFGLKKILLTGILLFSLVYGGMVFATGIWQLVTVFCIYGIYAAATEGISKAWITHTVPENETATAVGTLSGFQNLSALVASSTAGLIWYYFQPSATFLVSSLVAVLVFIFILSNCKEPPVSSS